MSAWRKATAAAAILQLLAVAHFAAQAEAMTGVLVIAGSATGLPVEFAAVPAAHTAAFAGRKHAAQAAVCLVAIPVA